MRDLGVGIIGCGVISTIYMQNMPMFAGLKLVACADMRAEAAQAQASAFGIAALSPDALLSRDDIDIVVNLTVPNAHFAVSHAALSAGKHVFTEKPLTTSVEDGRRLVTLADARGLKLGCAPDTFLGAGGRLARRLIDEGRVGRVLAGSAILLSHGMEHWHPDPEFFFKPGGGPVLDLGPYYLAALVNLLGPIVRVQAVGQKGFATRTITAPGPRTGQSITVETPTTLMALLEFVQGTQVMFTMSWDVWKHGHPAIELYGTEGSLRVPDPNFFGGAVEATARDGDWAAHTADALPFGRPNYRGPAWPQSRPSQANYRCLGLAELASAVLRGTPHRASGRLALHALEAMHGILTAADTGRAVAVETQVERPPALPDDAAIALARAGATI